MCAQVFVWGAQQARTHARQQQATKKGLPARCSSPYDRHATMSCWRGPTLFLRFPFASSVESERAPVACFAACLPCLYLTCRFNETPHPVPEHEPRSKTPLAHLTLFDTCRSLWSFFLRAFFFWLVKAGDGAVWHNLGLGCRVWRARARNILRWHPYRAVSAIDLERHP